MIRLANQNDIPRIIELLYQVHDVHANLRADLFKKGMKKFNEDELAEILKSSDKRIFVYVDEKIEGYAFCFDEIVANHSSLVDRKTLHIEDLCVDLHERAKGIGAKLYDFVKTFARENNYQSITLNVWYDNIKAYSFYQKQGLKIQKVGMEEIL